MLKSIVKQMSVVKLPLIALAFVAILSATSMAQTSTESLTKPTAAATPTIEPVATVTISQADADRCANNTRELVAARDEIRAYIAEIKARDIRDGNVEKLLATYERSLAALDKVIAAQDSLSNDKTELIRAQTDFIKTLVEMNTKKKDNPLLSVLKFAAGIVIGRSL